ncbi:sterol desaturase/sphingolipid hydroxylase (fatty acid hydroxylase superfamily) [Cellulophaga sp. RHA_52]|uniref:Fatty acid hydroxylase n=1 Tax=Cellulophaga lytica (strain ATCC 23178 / DSM 7489 / JCM 8516 / NBRC 14961 / NCIMB 1423 / VKM B-1433 / Cy l20) TaxID=867900 RepID=F0RCR8_CELLC|nr:MULTISPECIES: sterol desaturase family protein [Cellulophaga]ADY30800.1 fatty acid hydroxylase [Cellulophaga lytica DSM 7489]TVZ09864.1 sterol desaturase/sphingolipid hydroxylase (fatty acid hydroxylase superfamily) [Cellulophaga sp. RHA_52]WQG78279.1 sterol desaturase family protein [Cellulophaga lytica]
MDLTNPLVYGGPAFIIFILLELAYSKSHEEHHDLYDWKDLFASGFMGVGSAILAAALKVISAIVIFEFVFELCNPEVNGVNTNLLGYESFGYAWYVWLLCQLADDFTYYWFHRANHEIRILWAAHIVHHSSDNFNLGTAVRNGWFTLLYKPLFYMWMPAIGFEPEMVVFCLGIEALWQFQLHTVLLPKLGIFEKFMNTHTMHQVHHAQNVEYLDKNHGGFLNIFDRMFGTWLPLDDSIDVKYGVIHAPNSNNPIVILTHEFKDIWMDMKKSKKLSHKLMYVFGPPGWSHDGSTMTVKQQQRQFKEYAKSNSKKSFERPN